MRRLPQFQRSRQASPEKLFLRHAKRGKRPCDRFCYGAVCDCDHDNIKIERRELRWRKEASPVRQRLIPSSILIRPNDFFRPGKCRELTVKRLPDLPRAIEHDSFSLGDSLERESPTRREPFCFLRKTLHAIFLLPDAIFIRSLQFYPLHKLPVHHKFPRIIIRIPPVCHAIDVIYKNLYFYKKGSSPVSVGGTASFPYAMLPYASCGLATIRSSTGSDACVRENPRPSLKESTRNPDASTSPFNFSDLRNRRK